MFIRSGRNLALVVLLVVQLALGAFQSNPTIAMAASSQTSPHEITGQAATTAWRGVERWAGANRFETAVEVSKRAFPRGTDTVIVATGANWPDALCAAPLCGVTGASLLLVQPNAIPTSVRNEIVRLGARSVIILGGTGAVSSGVETALSGIVGEVRRIAGANRYATAAKIAAEVMASPSWDGSAFYATGANFPDALGASAIAASRKMPILLSEPTRLPGATLAVDEAVTFGFIVGGSGAVGSGVESSLRSRMSVVRLAGSNRYATTKAVMDHAVANWGTSVERVGIASGANFPDALAAGVALGAANQGQLLTNPTSLASATSTFLNGRRSQTQQVIVFGGTGAVSASVASEVNALMWSADFSGTGNQVAGPFTLAQGLTVANMTHTGASNFIVVLLDSNGNYVDLLANEIGDFGGTQAVGIGSRGSYYLEIVADGPWSISLSQPRPTVSTLPFTASFSGNGPTATNLFRLTPGARTFTLTHTGASNFIVVLWDSNGNYVDLLANEIGPFTGSAMVGAKAGGYLLNVQADGPWSISIR